MKLRFGIKGVILGILVGMSVLLLLIFSLLYFFQIRAVFRDQLERTETALSGHSVSSGKPAILALDADDLKKVLGGIQEEKKGISRKILESLTLPVLLSLIVILMGTYISYYYLDRGIVKPFHQLLHKLRELVDKVLDVSKQQATGSSEQATAIQEASITFEELVASARQTGESARGVERDSELTISTMESVKKHIATLVTKVLDLGDRSRKISSILDVIDEISAQVNLLALNAAIEAARAGEAGRGFSVVAGEVRRLAERTTDSTKVIKSLVEENQRVVNSTVMMTEDVTKSLEGNYSQFSNTLRSAKEIIIVTRQETTAIEQMLPTISQINQVARDIANGTEEIEKSLSSLENMVNELGEIVSGKKRGVI